MQFSSEIRSYVSIELKDFNLKTKTVDSFINKLIKCYLKCNYIFKYNVPRF